MAERILIGMSGGVDSTVAAMLLQSEGYDCLGATMHMTCETDASDARTAAQRLGIPFTEIDASERFERCVIRPFVETYEAGGTPNPCVECNRCLKFSFMYDKARAMGCELIATGHYVRSEQRADGRWILRKGVDAAKDQSYFLYMLTQEVLAHARFPLGGLTKSQVRALAAERGLVNARKHDSQDICFVPDGEYEGFIRRYTGREYPPGDFIDEQGTVIGRHRGLIAYTLGQRRGLGVSGGRPLYVCEKRVDDNTIVLAENDKLFTRTLVAEGLCLIDRDALEGDVRCAAKIRHTKRESPCVARQLPDGRLFVTFDESQRAVTPGQAVVLYDGDVVIGGATITRTGERA